MLYLFALIGMVAVVAAVWVALRPQPTVAKRPAKRPRIVAPDDDPEFLRRLGERPKDGRDGDLTG